MSGNGVRARVQAALALLFLLGVPLGAETGDPVPALDLGSAVQTTLAQLQEEWLVWLAAAYRGEDEKARDTVESLVATAGGLGMPRLPDLSLGASAHALRHARQGDPERARLGLEAAERLDPGRPEVAFVRGREARLRGEYLAAWNHDLSGFLRLFSIPRYRSVWLHDVGIWLLAVVVLTALGCVALLMASRGVYLLHDTLDLLGAVPRPIAWIVTLLMLLWPILLPSGIVWLTIYWSILLWGRARGRERTLLVGIWLILATAPLVAFAQLGRLERVAMPQLASVEAAAQGKLEGTLLADLDRLRAALPNSAALTHFLADLHISLGEYENARPLYLEVLETEPENLGALVDVGSCYYQRGDENRALDYFLRAIEIDPGSAAAHFNLSQVYADQYRFDLAAGTLKTAQALAAEAVSAWLDQSSTERVVALTTGLRRVGEIRMELQQARRGAGLYPLVGKSWWWAGPLSLLAICFGGVTAVALLGKTRRRRPAPPERWLPEPWDRWRRVLVPGLPEAEAGRWLRAIVSLFCLVVLFCLPLAGRIGFPLPWSFEPGPGLLLALSSLGLAAYLLYRMVGQSRGREG